MLKIHFITFLLICNFFYDIVTNYGKTVKYCKVWFLNGTLNVGKICKCHVNSLVYY